MPALQPALESSAAGRAEENASQGEILATDALTLLAGRYS
jgi:hypothetical protein